MRVKTDYTAKEIFNLCNDAICECPQCDGYDEFQVPSCLAWRGRQYTFEDMIDANNTDAMLLFFSDDDTLFHHGYSEFLSNDILASMRRARAAYELEIANELEEEE